MLLDKEPFQGLNVTFNTTEDCNLACKYCYEINKRKKDLDLDKAYKFIDLLLSDDRYLNDEEDVVQETEQGVVLDFIGGDSLMNVDVVEKILEYWVFKVNTVNTQRAKRARSHWRCSLSSNGTLFSDPKVKAFLEKWKGVFSIGVSIDGCKEIHDKNRIFAERGPNGEEIGSMDAILENWEWYRKTFPNSANATKATCSKDSIPYLYESLKFMHETLKIDYIAQNFIMEDMHLEESDYYELDKQLELCAHYVLEHRDEMCWTMLAGQFSNHRKITENDPRCGSGRMPCLGINGKIYPCFRWAPHTQTEATRDKMAVGDVWHGFTHSENFKKVREGGRYLTCSKEERCLECEYSSSCAYCIGGCYAEFGDFIRTTHICEVTKLQCKWAKVYWNEFNKLKGLPMEYDEKYQFDRVPKWTPKYLGTNQGD